MASLYLVAEGDSLTSGFGASGFGVYPLQLALLYPPSRMVSVMNFGAVGDTIAGLTAEAAAEVTPVYDSRKNPVLLVWIGTNDIYNGGTPAAVYADLVTYCAARRAAGYTRIVTFTLLPRSAAGTPAGFEADRLTFNANVRANYLTYADALADVALDARIGISGCELDTTYYNADKIHLNSTGYGVVAAIAKPAVDRIA